MALKLREMDEHVTYLQQLQEDDGPVALINEFNVPPEDTDRFIAVRADDAAFMKRQPGFISTRLHRGTAGSTTFVTSPSGNQHQRSARHSDRVSSAARRRYPENAVATPHVSKKGFAA